MDAGRRKCSALKEVRARLADVLGVELNQRECSFEGECSGTCPKCRQEEGILNKALLSKGLLAAGAVGVAVGLTGCSMKDFNPKYLIDALRVIDDEKIDIYYMNAKAPCFIRDAAGNYIYLVLPVNFVV